MTLAEDLDYLNGEHTVFGEVGEGFDVLDKLNEAYCDKEHRPYRDIRLDILNQLMTFMALALLYINIVSDLTYCYGHIPYSAEYTRRREHQKI